MAAEREDVGFCRDLPTPTARASSGFSSRTPWRLSTLPHFMSRLQAFSAKEDEQKGVWAQERHRTKEKKQRKFSRPLAECSGLVPSQSNQIAPVGTGCEDMVPSSPSGRSHDRHSSHGRGRRPESQLQLAPLVRPPYNSSLRPTLHPACLFHSVCT